MDNISLIQEEKAGCVIYTFGFAYTTKASELEWVEKAIVATKGKTGKWTYDINKTRDISSEEFGTFQSLITKVNQVVETEAKNLAGIKVIHPKPKAAA